MNVTRNEEGAGRRDQKVPASPLQCSPFLPSVVTRVRKLLDEVHVDLPVGIFERRDVQHFLADVDEPVVEARRLEVASSSKEFIRTVHLLEQLYEDLQILFFASRKAQHLERGGVLRGDLVELHAHRVRQRQFPQEYRHRTEYSWRVSGDGLVGIFHHNREEVLVSQLGGERRNVLLQTLQVEVPVGQTFLIIDGHAITFFQESCRWFAELKNNTILIILSIFVNKRIYV